MSQPEIKNLNTSLLTCAVEKAAFLNANPRFQSTSKLDILRATDYFNLNRLGQIYLDYTGGGLYADSQLKAHLNLLSENIFGNPHSTNPTSQAATRLVDSARVMVLNFFHADPAEYVCVFTPNASGALKLVGESYPFRSSSRYLLTYDNHNSVNGIREFARSKGASIHYVPVMLPEMHLNAEELACQLHSAEVSEDNLFAYPAQSNFSGVQHDLDWIAKAHACGWDVLLDAAAFVPTNQLDLSQVHPDFVSLSFYKIFGYPTGVGALIVSRKALAKLQRPWFAGGTITVASVQGDRHFLHQGAEGFEDGTLNYLTLPAVEIGLRHIQKIGYEMIHTRVACLSGWLLEKLFALRHSNGEHLVRIFGPINTERRGGTLAMNFYDPAGHFIDHLRVEARANESNISIRTGCFCNPGDGEMALGLSVNELNTCFGMKPRMEYQDFRTCLMDKSTGAVRISLGLVSTFEDVYAMVKLAHSFLDKPFGEI
ncbi:MAG: aminotransferase [Chloroflexi bacterium HGW-Chloroflexi-10]|nr:MAG: aminotransferase [Chloroflexi bacterium HGW-Chloroflexi-10]